MWVCTRFLNKLRISKVKLKHINDIKTVKKVGKFHAECFMEMKSVSNDVTQLLQDQRTKKNNKTKVIT